eukprot:TRINITY_DN3925_c0_g1_i2.p1 TRINITY_DN3925_c0_g1~~TRINITY_DN3925_c0_g1_i2.p1  ORF type:complete len:340 (+),score=67.43 TRINITY_DN3925_c0_g1_i2:64-1020(+)
MDTRMRVMFAFFTSLSMFGGKRVMEAHKSPKNNPKCTYSWQGKEGSPVSTVSFGVPNCAVYCKPAVGEYRFNKVFAQYFQGKPVGKKCSCQNMDGEELFKMPGACPEDAADKCYADYLRQATDTYTDEFNKNAVRVVHHEELYHETTFKPTCLENQCPNGQCFNIFLPFLEFTRTAREKRLRAEAVRQAAIEGSNALTGDQKEIVENMGRGEMRHMIEMALEEEPPMQKEELRKRLDVLEQRAADGEAVVVADFDPEAVDEEIDPNEELTESDFEEPLHGRYEAPREITHGDADSDSEYEETWVERPDYYNLHGFLMM